MEAIYYVSLVYLKLLIVIFPHLELHSVIKLSLKRGLSPAEHHKVYAL